MGRRTAALAAALGSALFAPSAHAAETLEEQVDRAIERGIAVVRRHLDPEGAGTTRYHESYPVGDTSLLLYTLVKSGVAVDDPQVRRSLEWLRYRKPEQTYSAAVFVLALDAFRDKALDPQIAAAAKWLEECHSKEGNGRFSYPGTHTDLSNSQYGALGLWAAERHGHRAPVESWAALLAAIPVLQNASGGFTYRDGDVETGSMTVGALTVLHLALDRVPAGDARFRKERRRAQESLERGWAYLERNLRVDLDPHGPRGTRFGWRYYYLYGLERLASIAGRERIAQRDWYAEGARHLVADQREDGSWGEPWDTCFALLFLRRATLTAMGESRRAAEGDGVATPRPRPVRPPSSVRWIRRWLVLGPVEDPRDELFDAPPFAVAKASPVARVLSGRWTWSPLVVRENFVRLDDPSHDEGRTQRWAFTYLQASADADAVLWLGNDNGVRVLVDGEVLLDRHLHEWDDWDTHALPVRLAAGTHRLMLQIENDGGQAGFWLRIARPDGTACPDVRPTLRPDGSDLAETALAQPDSFTDEELLRLLPRSRLREISFDVADHLDRVAIAGEGGEYPLWRGSPGDAKSRGPNPGAFGFLGMHGDDQPMRAIWKVLVPEVPSKVRVRASAASQIAPGRADSVLQVVVFDGSASTKVISTVVGPDAKPDASNWRWFEGDLAAWAGKDVLVVLEAHQGGRELFYEDLWIDAVEVRATE